MLSRVLFFCNCQWFYWRCFSVAQIHKVWKEPTLNSLETGSFWENAHNVMCSWQTHLLSTIVSLDLVFWIVNKYKISAIIYCFEFVIHKHELMYNYPYINSYRWRQIDFLIIYIEMASFHEVNVKESLHYIPLEMFFY